MHAMKQRINIRIVGGLLNVLQRFLRLDNEQTNYFDGK